MIVSNSRCSRYAWLLFVALGTTVTSTQDAAACSCAPAFGIEDSTDVAFIGRVQARRRVRVEEDVLWEYSLVVLRAGRGVRVGQTVRVRTEGMPTACGFTIAPGHLFVVYGDRTERGWLVTSTCHRSHELEASEYRSFVRTWSVSPRQLTVSPNDVQIPVRPQRMR